jgi:hypothetical protein
MKNLFRLTLALVTVILFLPRQGAAQWDYLDVAPGYETLNLAVEGDTTATGDPVSLNRVYRLERGGMYLMNGRIVNIKGAPLRVWAAEGAGAKPLMIMAVNETGANDDFARIEGDAHFKNIYISGIDNIGIQDRYIMAIYDSAARIIWDGVHVDHSRQSHFRTYATDTKLLFNDCEFRNAIDLATPSNGRFFDGRGLMADSIMFQNCTFYLNSQRMFRTDGALTKNIIFDHNTFYQNVYGSMTASGLKQSGPIETGKGVNVRITNNIFQDLGVEGMRHLKTLVPSDRMPIIHVDSLKSTTIDESSRNWLVRNNAYGWSPIFPAFWNSWGIDTLVKGPAFISPYGDSAFFRTQPNFVQSGNFEELIKFADAPSPDTLMKWVRYRFESNFSNVGNPDPRADRNGIGDLTTKPETFGLESDPFNFDYPTSQQAYTAGDGGFPLGDLNWFPTRKAEWQTWVTDVKPEPGIATAYTLEQNFPNPFNPTTEIQYTLPRAARITLAIYNALGQEVVRLVNNEGKTAGTYGVKWNGKDTSGRTISSGVYFYRLQTPDAQITRKMTLIK